MKRRNFVITTGSYALLLPVMKTFADIHPGIKEGIENTLKSMCIAAFSRFEAVWDFNDFWKRGNTFDACLNFTDALQQTWPDDPVINQIQQKVSAMLEKNLHYFKSFDPGGLWADDFGWWGLMGLNARKHLLHAGNQPLADKYMQLSTDLCWLQERNHAYDFSATANPVPHGCSNGDANGKDKGVKNTVTNVLFFLLSIKIYRLMLSENASDQEKYLDMAYRQWIWFDRWFQLTQYQYLKKTTSGGGLVQERPMAFFKGSDYMTTSHPTWENGWVWTGDQGMLLTALLDMLAIKDNLASWIAKNKTGTDFNLNHFEGKINGYISLISKGIKTALFSDKDGVIREAPFKSNMGPEFGNDYLAGRGILMRYLGQLDPNITGFDFSNNIEKSVRSIWETRDTSDNQFQPEFTNARNDELYILQFRQQSGIADDIIRWDIAKMNKQQKFGVCQSIGLDAFGALLRQRLDKT